MKMKTGSVPWRTFLTGSATALLTARSYARVLGANERLRVGLIGSGGRGRRVLGMFLKMGAECPAICDVYEANGDQGLSLAGDEATGYSDHRRLLERKDLDAVVIGTPDHWHHDQLLDALDAGKDVYLEKPMSHSLAQGASMVRAVRSSRQIVQVGMQRRSSQSVMMAREALGEIGQVNAVRAQWCWNMEPLQSRQLRRELDWKKFCGPAGKQPLSVGDLDNVAFFRWRYWWAFSGGNCTDQGTHLMDVVQWFCNDSRPPRAAVCQGNVFRLKPAETPDVFSAVFEYPGFVATWTLIYTNSYGNGWRIVFQGRKGTLVLDNLGYRVYPESGERSGSSLEPSVDYQGEVPSEPHVANFIECVKSRREPNAPVEVGHWGVTGPHLANIALRAGKRAVLNRQGDGVKRKG